MFSDGSRAFKWQMQILMGIVICWCLAILISAVLICIPLQSFWDPTLKGRCIDLGAFYYGMQIPNVITDSFLIICPVRMILSLDLTMKSKVSAMAMFLLGLL